MEVTRLRRLLASFASYYGSLRHLKDRRIALLSGANLLNVMSVSIVVPLLPTYADRLGAGPVLIGVLFTLPTAARALCSTPFGYLADRTARKPLIVLGTSLGAVSVVGLGLTADLEVLLALRALDGIASAMQTPSTTAYLGDVTDEDTRGSVMGAYRTVGMAGVAFGPAVGGVLAGIFSPAVPFVVLGTFTLGGGLLLGARLPMIGSEEEDEPETDRELIDFSTAAVAGNLTPTVLALSIWALVLFGLSLSTIRVVPPLLLALGGVASALGAPALTALQYESAPEGNEGSLLGFYSTVYAIGGTAGPLLGGWVTAWLGVRPSVSLIGASWVLAAVVILVGVRDSGVNDGTTGYSTDA